jgi:hypothetical protein
VDVGGVQKDIPLKQYAIDQIKQSVINEAKRKIGRGGGTDEMTMAQAGAWADREIHKKLKQHAVVDDEQKVNVTGALAGIVANKDGSLTDDAQAAMDWYLTLAADPAIGAAYASQYLGTDAVRAYVATVQEMVGRENDLPEAMVRAQNELTKPVVLDTSGNKAFESREAIGAKLNDMLKTVTEDQSNSLRGWANWVFGQDNLDVHTYERIGMQTQAISDRVGETARKLKAANPNMTDDAALKVALDKTSNEAIHVGGQIVFGNPNQGQRLDQVMGMSGSKQGPNDAVSYYVHKNFEALFNADDEGRRLLKAYKLSDSWLNKFNRNVGGVVDLAQGVAASAATVVNPTAIDQLTTQAASNFSAANRGLSGQPQLPYYTEVDPRSGNVLISFYNKDGMTLLTRSLSLQGIGKEYKNDLYNNPSLMSDVVKTVIPPESTAGKWINMWWNART